MKNDEKPDSSNDEIIYDINSEASLNDQPDMQAKGNDVKKKIRNKMKEKNTPYASTTEFEFDKYVLEFKPTTPGVKNKYYDKCMEEVFKGHVVTFLHAEDENNFIIVTTTRPPFYIPLGTSDGPKKLKYFYNKYKGLSITSTRLKNYYDFFSEYVKTEFKPIIQEPRAFRIKDTIYYDLNDKVTPRHVVIDTKDFHIHPGKKLRFRNNPIQDTQVVPKKGGSINRLDKYLKMDEEQKYLLKIYIICAFIPDIEHPILLLEGDAKSGKSTLSYILKRLIDPTTSGILRMPDKMESLILNLDQHYFVPYDNMPTKLKDNISDTLCQAVTGIGIEVRKLYTDSEIISRHFKRTILLNGINIGVLKKDLHRRILSIRLSEIAKDSINDNIKNEFDKERDLILGAIFTAISKTLKKSSEVNSDDMKNLSDFQKYGYACAESFGDGRGKIFLDLYDKKVKEQEILAAYDDDLATAIIKLMEDKEMWPIDGSKANGTMEKLRVALQETARKPGLDYLKTVAYLKPNILSGILQGIIGLLGKQGIIVEQLPRVTNYRPWLITNENFIKSDANSEPSNNGIQPAPNTKLTDTLEPSKQSSEAVIKPSEDTFIDSNASSPNGILEPMVDTGKEVPEADISKPEYKGMTVKRKKDSEPK